MRASRYALFDEIYAALFVDSGQPDEEVAGCAREFRHLLALPAGLDVFDGWIAFLLEDESRGRFVWRDPGGSVSEVSLRAEELDEVLAEFLMALQRQLA